ncbi:MULTISPECIES: maltokinase N-terminal cap-like domain-containing protein [Cryobacterium]|uniref:maltokinase N-terminal cap-like domain-containing protein n=1 Tax=Cryobacterium TaxID=69578 RepID=UPI000CD438F9|nr:MULTISPECIES: phosphotransferase [Cryobacterium]POH67938.1 phosphotransferase [Cryobacterium zongtaii]TFC47942.1 phosphotransferase [Cryobacterium sp. TMN-39-2]
MKHASAGTGIDLTPAIDGWVGAQRWFAGKAHSPVLRSIGQWALPTDEAGVRIACHLVLDTASRFSTLYQLPLTERTAPLPESSALIAQTVGRDGLPRYVYDAPHDPVYAAALLRFITSAASLSSDEPGGVTARGELLRAGMGPDDSTPYSVTASRVISGEQSNTSIILDVADEAGRPGRPVICKVFRVVAAGSNPDVSVQSALAGAGSRFVPEPIGAVSGEWTNPLSAARHSGHLVFAQEFLPGVDDAWRVALAAAAAGDDFSIPAHALGVATAAVHRDLDRVFPTVASTPDVINQLCLTMRERYRLAAREVPELAAHREAIEAVFARAKAAPWPRLQRIHGDYHLGQVLDVPGRGWVLIDFEGEPLRPLAERSLPDIPLRDVAGMLRSFDYVGATIAMRDPAAAPAAIEWAMTARAAFLLGYHAGDGDSQAGTAHAGQEALLAAFELDKAVYESIYEIRNRPTWLPIPLRAVRRLAQDAHAAAHSPG